MLCLLLTHSATLQAPPGPSPSQGPLPAHAAQSFPLNAPFHLPQPPRVAAIAQSVTASNHLKKPEDWAGAAGARHVPLHVSDDYDGQLRVIPTGVGVVEDGSSDVYGAVHQYGGGGRRSGASCLSCKGRGWHQTLLAAVRARQVLPLLMVMVVVEAVMVMVAVVTSRVSPLVPLLPKGSTCSGLDPCKACSQVVAGGYGLREQDFEDDAFGTIMQWLYTKIPHTKGHQPGRSTTAPAARKGDISIHAFV